MNSPSIILFQLGVVLSAGHQLISYLFKQTHLALSCSGLALLPAGNQLISQLFMYGLSFYYPVPTWLLAIS